MASRISSGSGSTVGLSKERGCDAATTAAATTGASVAASEDGTTSRVQVAHRAESEAKPAVAAAAAAAAVAAAATATSLTATLTTTTAERGKVDDDVDELSDVPVVGEMRLEEGREFVWTLDDFGACMAMQRGRYVISPRLKHPDSVCGCWLVQLRLYPYCPRHEDCNHLSIEAVLSAAEPLGDARRPMVAATHRRTDGRGLFHYWLTRRRTQETVAESRKQLDFVGLRRFAAEFTRGQGLGAAHLVGRLKLEDLSYGIVEQLPTGKSRLVVHCVIDLWRPDGPAEPPANYRCRYRCSIRAKGTVTATATATDTGASAAWACSCGWRLD